MLFGVTCGRRTSLLPHNVFTFPRVQVAAYAGISRPAFLSPILREIPIHYAAGRLYSFRSVQQDAKNVPNLLNLVGAFHYILVTFLLL